MLNIVKIILKKEKYLITAVVIGFIIFVLSYILTVTNISHKNLFAYAQMNGYVFTFISMLLSLLISAGVGSYVSLAMFKRDISRGDKAVKGKAGGVGGALLGAAASGCPTCGVPLLGLVGFPLGLATFPFKGIEIKILSLALITYSLFAIVKSIEKSLHCDTKSQ